MMNERIQKLMEQADYNAPGGRWKEYFAELIVKEVTNIVLHYTDVDEGVSVAKKHFGLDK
jgi:hypothetical protein